MAVSMFTRSVTLRNILNINNLSAIGSTLNITQNSNGTLRLYATKISNIDTFFDDNLEAKPGKKMSRAMMIYLERAKEYQTLMEKEITQYELGKRHLANMMGEDPDQFTQQDINRAIQYLLPSGLYDWRARPLMIHPSELFENKKEAEFDESGRPHHYLFYTCRPNYYEVLYNIADSIHYLNEAEDKKIEKKKLPSAEDKAYLIGTDWLSEDEIAEKLMEKITTAQYEYMIKSFNKVANHPMSNCKIDFIMEYRKQLKSTMKDIKLPPMEYDSNDRPFITVPDCMRKSARGVVKVLGNGSGNITINGEDFLHFGNIQCREQVCFQKWYYF